MPSDPISRALDELARARANLRRLRNRQVRNAEDRLALRATALAWFNSHRREVVADAKPELLKLVDDCYTIILSGSERNTTKARYQGAMDAAKASLIDLRGHLVVSGAKVDATPDFSPLAGTADMRGILERRWVECTKCVSANANLAAIVMMGGLLEALFVARANKLADKSVLFRSSSVPVDKKTGKPVPLEDWMLKTYLQVGHDVGWITRAGRDIAAVVGEYRNYVHPEKERRHGVALEEQDSAIIWNVTKGLVTQLLSSAKA